MHVQERPSANTTRELRTHGQAPHQALRFRVAGFSGWTPLAVGNPPPYRQTIVKATDVAGKAAVDLYGNIMTDLSNAYASGDMEDAVQIANARVTMFALRDAADALAKAGKGVPYFLDRSTRIFAGQKSTSPTLASPTKP